MSEKRIKPQKDAGGKGDFFLIGAGNWVENGCSSGVYLHINPRFAFRKNPFFLDSEMDELCAWWLEGKEKQRQIYVMGADTCKPKETKMDKIAVRVHNKHLNCAFQGMALEAGITWPSANRGISHRGFSFLLFNNLEMSYADTEGWVLGHNYKIFDAITDMDKIVEFFQQGKKPKPPFMKIAGEKINFWDEDGFIMECGMSVSRTEILQAFKYMEEL